MTNPIRNNFDIEYHNLVRLLSEEHKGCPNFADCERRKRVDKQLQLTTLEYDLYRQSTAQIPN